MGDFILVKSGAGVQQCLSFKDAELDIFLDTYVQGGCECQSESDNMKNLMFPGISEELMHEGLPIEILRNTPNLHEETLQYDNKQYTLQY
ncbi:hypothetical protein CsSME_00014722 [Camellia sinensis var. sinensis]